MLPLAVLEKLVHEWIAAGGGRPADLSSGLHPIIRLRYDAFRVIYHAADVVHGREVDPADDAGLGIDLYLGDVAAVREGGAEAALGDAVHVVGRLACELLRDIFFFNKPAPPGFSPFPLPDALRS